MYVSIFLKIILLLLTGFQTNLLIAESYKKSNFNRLKPTKLNISVFIFNDKNQNGKYDLGDSAMTGIVTQLIKPNGMVIDEKSNKAGYANFKMALGSSNYRDINTVQEIYTFNTLIPPNWKVTTNNKKQKILFNEKVGSPGGLIASNAPNWVGLAPNLTIKGRLRTNKGENLPKDINIHARGPNGKIKNLKLKNSGEYNFDVEQGKWELLFESKSRNWEKIKKIEVNHAPIRIMDILIGSKELPRNKNLRLENFDWINFSQLEKIPNGHLDLNWNYLMAVHHRNSSGPGYNNVLNSGHGIGYNSSGHPVTITANKGESFDFIGGYFTVGWNQANGEIINLQGFRNGKKIAENKFKLSYLGPIWIEADLRRIDKLIIATEHYWQFGAEDLKFRTK